MVCVRALCGALKAYEGAIIAVSHDEAFVNQVFGAQDVAAGEVARESGEIWVLSKRKLSRFEGTFKDYKNEILKKILAGGIPD